MATIRWIPATLLPLTLIACGDTVGAGAGIQVRATSSALTANGTEAATSGGLVFQDDAGRTYTATQALMRISEIELELPNGIRCRDIVDELAGGARCDDDDGDDDDDDDEIRIDGPFVINLLDGTSTPSLADVRVPAVNYEEIEFELSDRSGGGDLDGHSFALRATFDDNGSPAELVLRLDGDSDIEIERPGGVPLDSGANLVILLDASVWMQGVPLQACIDEKGLQVVGGVLSISDDDDCDDLEDAFHDRIDDSCSFDSDDDDDDDDDDDVDDDDDDRDDD